MRSVPPTKSSLLRLREELAFARLGRDLLDQKRSILVAELMTLVDQAAVQEDKVRAELERAYAALEDTVLAIGRTKVAILGSAVNAKSAISIRQRRVMGVSLPVVETSFTDGAPYYSPMDTSPQLEAAAKEFRDALALLGKFAELKVSITRLAAEVKRTIRKVNALEKIAVPELEETVRFVVERLEENEREMFTLMKLVKGRLEASKEEAPQG